MSDNHKYVVKAGVTAHDQYETDISAERAGWDFCSLRVVALAKGESITFETGDSEVLVLPLEGSVTVKVGGQDYEIAGRESVFTDITDYIFIPRSQSVQLTALTRGRFAIPGATASKDLPVRYCPRSEAKSGLRGSGASSRQVNNYALGNAVETSHLLVTEVLTPGGNWSSFPPHKHDEHTENERVLEEVYYFEIREHSHEDGTTTPGFGLQRVYDSPGKPIDVCTEVRHGDTVLVPHGYHGPSVAAPGHDMYYLNVMAGPAEDAVWLMTDDPVHTWQRQAWEGQDIDPRLPFTELTEETL